MVKEGNLDKLGPLYERYKKVLFAFFYRMNFDESLSKDLVQNVFVRILNYRHTFRGDGEFKIWMFHIARNVNHEYFRRNKRHVLNDRLNQKHENLSGFGEDNASVKKDDDLKTLNNAIDRLPQDKRELITLSKLNGMKYKDIGLILNCSENTVKIKVFRALKDLKIIFETIRKSHG